MAKTIYEQYLNTDALLACQKDPADLVNHDELLFQTVHQVSELWMKAVVHELHEVIRIFGIREHELLRAVHLLQRVRALLGYLGAHLSVLESMHPADYMPIRAGLGSGSGMDSPGFRSLVLTVPQVNAAFRDLLARRNLNPLDLQRDPARDYPLFQVMQGLLDLDEGVQRFRYSHVMLAMREIGNVAGTGGVAIPMLMQRAQQCFFPELWEAIGHLSEEHRARY